MTPAKVVDEIFETFKERGGRHYGESVTERQHALQCATFATRAGEPDNVVAACILHDYGHLLHDLGEDVAGHGVDARHEDLGAAALASWFGPEVVDPVRLHVAAKRYLCWKEPGYLAGLSSASYESLMLQGGPMTAGEASAFESHPHYVSAVSLRRYDDEGKVTDMETPELEAFRGVLERCVRNA